MRTEGNASTRGLLLLLATWLLAVAAGVFRAMELAYSFEDETQILLFWTKPTLMLFAAVLVFAVMSAALIIKMPKYSPGETNPPGLQWVFLEAAASLALILSCVFGIIDLQQEYHAVLLVFHLLGILTGACVLVSAFCIRGGAITAGTGFYYTVPVFWCCFYLVLDFWSHSANPILFAFIYTMLGLIFTSLSAHSAAGFFFGRPRTRRSLAYGCLGLFFILMTIVSHILYPFFEPSDTILKAAQTTLPAMLRYAFIVLHMSALLYAVFTGAFRSDRPEPAVQDDTPEEPDFLAGSEYDLDEYEGGEPEGDDISGGSEERQ